MNMHVMMNHMILLEHGTFNLNRHNVVRKRMAREPSLEIIDQPNQAIVPACPTQVTIKPEPVPQEVHRELKPQQVPEFQPFRPEVPAKVQRIENPPSNALANLLGRFGQPTIPIPQDLDIPGRSPWVPPNPYDEMPTTSERAGKQRKEEEEEVNDDSMQGGGDGSEQARMDMQEQEDMMNGNPTKLSDVINDFLARLRPMKQLGFIRPSKSTYCVVCLKYVKSYHECNWKHTPMEDRVAEMWYRRFGKERPSGKNQLLSELEEIREWVLAEEANGNIMEINN